MLLTPAIEGASSSHGLGGRVGPTLRTGSEIAGAGAIVPIPLEVADGLALTLKMVAAANKRVVAAKHLGFKKIFDMSVSP